jgi:hypothetical protein
MATGYYNLEQYYHELLRGNSGAKSSGKVSASKIPASKIPARKIPARKTPARKTSASGTPTSEKPASESHAGEIYPSKKGLGKAANAALLSYLSANGMVTTLVGRDEVKMVVHGNRLTRDSNVFVAAMKEWLEGQTRTIKLTE